MPTPCLGTVTEGQQQTQTGVHVNQPLGVASFVSSPASPLMVCFSVLVWGFLFGVSAPFYPSEFPLPSLPAVPLAALGLREGPN